MFLRCKTRKKDGKLHRYWSVVENRRVADGRVVQRQVLYLGEVNDAQRAAWCRCIEVFDEDRAAAAQIALFPEERAVPQLECEVVQVRLDVRKVMFEFFRQVFCIANPAAGLAGACRLVMPQLAVQRFD